VQAERDCICRGQGEHGSSTVNNSMASLYSLITRTRIKTIVLPRVDPCNPKLLSWKV
jgi:hypothetical protein